MGGRARGIARRERLLSARAKKLETLKVDLVRCNVEQIAGRLRENGAAVAERAT